MLSQVIKLCCLKLNKTAFSLKNKWHEYFIAKKTLSVRQNRRDCEDVRRKEKKDEKIAQVQFPNMSFSCALLFPCASAAEKEDAR